LKANRVYRLIVTRGGREPAYFAKADRRDRVEVVSIDDGEPILYWDLPVGDASRLVRELKADLAGMDAEEFLTLWEGADAG
jgi:hypothetical protein